jgi:hypothetical protein
MPHQHRMFAERRRKFDPPRAGCLAKTKFALEGRTTRPSLTNSRVIASRAATTLAQLSLK